AGEALTQLLYEAPNGSGFTVMRLLFRKADGMVSIANDPRHLAGAPGGTGPFDAFCAQSLLPLANGLAQATGAPQFHLRPFAGQPFHR
ncbi:MAG: hypothetical protein HC779_07025, partial [Phyllobacteriaceae bacterium]|nr:hypothetical protein [Phyllobacteriaceae bacterium]